MGAVYLAQRADGEFEQTVAIKVLAAHAATPQFRERFVLERQILASFSHPNITKLLDGGITDSGTPYLVMEYVEGRHLDCYCDERKLELRARLELFRKVCAPVAYAHRNLVVHRDLKPSNILVTKEGVPVLLDFGTAKLISDSGATMTGRSPLLTLRYASPEHRLHRPVTTQSDVFSLGVILYELLTGAWPFGDASSPAEMLQSIAAESTMRAPENVVTEAAAETRAASLKSLRKQLVGDLGSILGKALDAVPERRYESVQALSDDVGNWLEGLPVKARRATWGYRAGRFVARHRVVVSASCVFVMALSGAAVFSAQQAAKAAAQARKAEKVGDFLNTVLASASQMTFDPQNYTVAQLLDAAVPRLEKEWKGDPEVEAAIRLNLGYGFTGVQRAKDAKPMLEAARRLYRKLGDRKGEALAAMYLGITAELLGTATEAEPLLREALSLVQALGKEAPPKTAFFVRMALAEHLGAIKNSELDYAAKLIQEALEIAPRDSSITPGNLAVAHTNRGAILMNQGKTADAEAQFLRAVETFKLDAPVSRSHALPVYYLFILNNRARKFDRAADFGQQHYQTLSQVIGPNHPQTAQAKMMWARVLSDTGRTEDAVRIGVETIPVVRAAYPALSNNLWNSLNCFAHLLNKAGRFHDAEPLGREQLPVLDKQQLPEADARRGNTVEEFALSLEGEGKKVEARAAWERAASIYDGAGPAFAGRAKLIRESHLSEGKTR